MASNAAPTPKTQSQLNASTLAQQNSGAGALQTVNTPSNANIIARGQKSDPVMAYMGRDNSGAPVTWSTTGAKLNFLRLDQQTLGAMATALDSAYGKGAWNRGDLKDAWEMGVDISALSMTNTDEATRYVTPLDGLLAKISEYGAMGLRPNGSAFKGGAGAGGVRSSVTKSVNLTDPASARALIDNSLTQYLGRAATSTEQQAFLKALNVQQQANPTITKQTSNTSGTSTSTTSETTGGFNPSTFAEEYARGQEGAGEFQAATSLLDTFINALGSKV